jgi:hypothetical protein
VALYVPGGPYTVGVVTAARYAGVEGDLPFEYWNKEQTPFADLRSETGKLATIDYSESPPLLFAGEFVEWEALELTNLLEHAVRRVQGTQALNCPNCGGTVTLRRPGESVNAVCEYCLSLLNVEQSDRLAILQKFSQQATRVKPLIPLGTTGRMHGAEWTVLGMQQRTIRVEGVAYSWREYLLHSTERGFRYLTEYDGHWNDVVVLKSPPNVVGRTTRTTVALRGEVFRPFQHASAETTFVLGEFPWQIRVGEKAKTDDYVSPPRMLSREEVPGEVTWSLGEYTPPGRIWEAFKLPGSPPRPRGTYANQPSPYVSHRRLWPLFTVFAVLLLGVLFVRAGAGNRPVFREQNIVAENNGREEDVFVTPPFHVGGRPSSLRVALRTDVSNSWAAFDMMLVEQATGRTRELSREVAYYQGYEDGERWSEGSEDGAVTVPSVPAGTYRLLISPQGSAPMVYSVNVTRDAPAFWLYLLAFLALLVPPLIRAVQHHSFEHGRWMESDYPPVSDDDED